MDYSKKGLFQEHILMFQMDNIILHKHTSEASICKSGFPQKITPRFFSYLEIAIVGYEKIGGRLLEWKAHN